jgi:rhamnogalacturonyl hydrolase YesR
VTHYATFFEDLIHAVKSELVEKIEDLDRAVKTGNQSLSDQLAVQSANVRRLQDEVERLQTILDRQASAAEVDISDHNGAAATSSPS